MSLELSKKQKNVLEKARKTYGSRTQLTITAEECNELAIAVLKFMRYNNEEKGVSETFQHVLEERADVEIMLNHIDKIYGFTERQIQEEINRKIDRLQRWLDKTSDIEYTTVDRKVNKNEESSCIGCYYNEHFEEAVETGKCKECTNNKLK